MITQITALMRGYVKQKNTIDETYTARLEKIETEYGNGTMGRQQKAITKTEYKSRSTQLQRVIMTGVERECEKLTKRLNYLVSDINTKSLSELRSLAPEQLTPYVINCLKDKYEGDYYAQQQINELINSNSDVLHQIHFKTADEMLQNLQILKRDCADFVLHYTEEPDTNSPQGRTEWIRMQELNASWERFFEAFESAYIPSESLLDDVTPLTEQEQEKLETLYGLSQKITEEEKIQELLDNGHFDLVLRSNLSKYIPTDYRPTITLSEDGEKLISGELTPAMYAGLQERYGTGSQPKTTEIPQEPDSLIKSEDYGNDIAETLKEWHNAQNAPQGTETPEVEDLTAETQGTPQEPQATPEA